MKEEYTLAKHQKKKTSLHSREAEKKYTTDGEMPMQMSSAGYRINLSKMENAGDKELGED